MPVHASPAGLPVRGCGPVSPSRAHGDFREILRAHGAAVIPPIALTDAGPETLSYLQSKSKRTFGESMALSVLFLSGDITHLAGRGLAEVPRDRVLVKPVELAELERRIAAFVQEKVA